MVLCIHLNSVCISAEDFREELAHMLCWLQSRYRNKSTCADAPLEIAVHLGTQKQANAHAARQLRQANKRTYASRPATLLPAHLHPPTYIYSSIYAA